MFVATLTDGEVDMLLLALKYWRYQRRDSATRRHDRLLTNEELDVLVAKIGSGRLTLRPPEDDILSDLLSR